jgi:hypothetical protein
LIRKTITIVILAAALGAFLYYKPFMFEKPNPPRLIDRLPSADFIGKANILDLARETSGMMYYHKIPFRDFTSYEFLLGQAKMYGLNLQKQVYLFGNEGGDWGCMVEVSDSSKIGQGIERLRKFITIDDTTINDQQIFRFKKEKMYLHYERNYLFFYKGSEFKSYFTQVTKAKYLGINKTWKSFLSKKQFRNEHLVIFSNWEKLQNMGIKTAMFAHDSDSLSFNLKSYLRKEQPLFIAKKEFGKGLRNIENATKSIELHLDISELRQHPDDKLYIELSKIGKSFGFPFVDFLKAWDGDLSFMEGGVQKVQETYIETELDEDFNPSEIEKTREIIVPGYSVYFTSTLYAPTFIDKLIKKGILTQEQENFRFLFSPLLRKKNNQKAYQFYSGQKTPKIEQSSRNQVIWTKEGTRYVFNLDSLNTYEIFGSLQIPVRRIFRKNKLI